MCPPRTLAKSRRWRSCATPGRKQSQHSGHICVCGSLDGFDLFSADGRFERTVDISLAGSSALPNVASIGAAADATHLYISHDYGGLLKLRQVDFGVVARHSSLWPEGEEHKQLEEPRGLAVSDGLLYVADHGNGRIAVFASSGPTLTYARSFCGPGEQGYRPWDVDVANGLIYVARSSRKEIGVGEFELLIFAQADERCLQRVALCGTPMGVCAVCGLVVVTESCDDGDTLCVFSPQGTRRQRLVVQKKSGPLDAGEEDSASGAGNAAAFGAAGGVCAGNGRLFMVSEAVSELTQAAAGELLAFPMR
jgi:hypothetical protein